MHAAALSCNCMHYSTQAHRNELLSGWIDRTTCFRDPAPNLVPSGAFSSGQHVDSSPLTDPTSWGAGTHPSLITCRPIYTARTHCFPPEGPFCPGGTPLDPKAASLAFQDMARRSSFFFYFTFLIFFTFPLSYSYFNFFKFSTIPPLAHRASTLV
ncbi:uncharacterized protein BO80DRAFT_75166 [Aspergillus ibericus CBS 121593]|uniref:Uncharacterized protein n=1 Tax=Aspergillus ibericus CBS 121593 TaxID=1448316 RepID=A0A395HCG2_9EURO|nr:hypothetical protein BO80DRAFT_75166 [Aspergillus ibericus CBS 121593]RAL05617.1 hypothetical protein BO80DRAFT_75166 [Aspergillus ibericus CBS 121593]